LLHEVIRPFPCSWDGITLTDLSVGETHDFGAMADGLLAEGYIRAVDAAAESDGEPAVKPAKRAK